MKRALQIIGAVILCFTCSFADPATTSAMATAIGEAMVNGNAVTRSSAVLEGDRLTTGASAALILHLAGSSIHIGPNSEALYRGTTLELVSGSSEVQGKEAIVAGAYTFSPLIESRFVVQHEQANISLHLVSGNLKLSRGKDTRTITAPADYTLQDDQPIPAVKRHAITRAVPVAAGAAAGTSVVIAHWLTGKDAANSTACVSGKSPTSCK